MKATIEQLESQQDKIWGLHDLVSNATGLEKAMLRNELAAAYDAMTAIENKLIAQGVLKVGICLA